MRRRVGAVLALVISVAAAPASAQTAGDDWDVTESPERRMFAASTTFSTGVSVILRCVNNQFDAVIAGLPAAAPGTEWRTVSLQFGEAPAGEARWFVGTNPATVISRLPARLARQLREGGLVKLRVEDPGQAGRRVRYDLELPTSAANIDRTLSACGRPISDPRDALVESLEETGLPGGMEWARAPEPRYPDGRTFDRGFVLTSCLSRPNGQLTDCIVESEFPLGGGFGEAALRAASRARVRMAADPSAPVPIRMIVYSTNFGTASAVEDALRDPVSGSRIDRNR